MQQHPGSVSEFAVEQSSCGDSKAGLEQAVAGGGPHRGGGPLLLDDPVSTSVAYQHGIAVLAVSGEIDLASGPAVERAIAEVLTENPPSLIIDLLGVRFLGSAGVRILVTARDKFAEGGRFSVVAQGPITSRIIQLLGLQDLLSLHETVEEALSEAKAT